MLALCYLCDKKKTVSDSRVCSVFLKSTAVYKRRHQCRISDIKDRLKCNKANFFSKTLTVEGNEMMWLIQAEDVSSDSSCSMFDTTTILLKYASCARGSPFYMMYKTINHKLFSRVLGDFDHIMIVCDDVNKFYIH